MARNSLDDANAGGKKATWMDGVQPYKWRKGDNRIRLFGPIYTDYRHTVKTKNDKEYSSYCLGYDAENDQHFDNREERCPMCKLGLKGSVRHYINFVSMDDWDNRPANPKADWSPIYMADFSPSLVQALQKLKPRNHGVSVAHPTEGAIVIVTFDPDSKTPATMYTAAVDPDGRKWAFPKEIAALTVRQTMKSGQIVVHKGDGVVPASFIYERRTETLTEVQDSLRRNNYYGEQSSGGNGDAKSKAAARTLDVVQGLDSDTLPSKQKIVDLDAKRTASKKLDEPEESPDADGEPTADDEPIEIPF